MIEPTPPSALAGDNPHSTPSRAGPPAGRPSERERAWSPDDLARVIRFEQAQRWGRGERVPVEGYLAEFPALFADPARVLALIDDEITLREGLGEAPQLDEYVHRFPGHGPALGRCFALRQAARDGRLREPAAPRPAPQEAVTLPPPRAGADYSRPEAVTLAPDPAAPDALPAEGPAVPGYQIVRELGRGGMGVVYEARQTALRRTVALKMVLAGAHAGEADLARFRAEAEAVARLSHPNIVQIHEVGECGGLPYFSLEYVDGGSLADGLDGNPWPGRQAAELVEVLARAMEYAHQRGIIHRDLKPQNILLAADGTPKVTDFGLAKQLAEQRGLTQTGAVLGTPGYMAPEQAEGKAREIGPAADVYALGTLLYELLTGQPPFRAATALDTILLVLSADPAPPRERNPAVPRDLETICLKCLHKDPARRYAGAGRLAEDLRSFLAGEPIKARPVTTWERARKAWRRGDRWARRTTGTRLIPVLLGAGVLLLLGFVPFVTWGSSPWTFVAALVAVSFLGGEVRGFVGGAAAVGVVVGLGLLIPVRLLPGAPWEQLLLYPVLGGAVVGLLARRRWRALAVIVVLGAGLSALTLVMAPATLVVGTAAGLVYGVVSRAVAWYWKGPPVPSLVGTFWGSLAGACLGSLLLLLAVQILGAVSESLLNAPFFQGPVAAVAGGAFVLLSVLLGALLGGSLNLMLYRGVQDEERERLRRWGGL